MITVSYLLVPEPVYSAGLESWLLIHWLLKLPFSLQKASHSGTKQKVKFLAPEEIIARTFFCFVFVCLLVC